MKNSGVKLNKKIAVAYLARGADKDWLFSFEQFLKSYRLNSPGFKHTLYIIFKGFINNSDLEIANALFKNVTHKPIFLGDKGLDVGAYIEWANMIEEDFICVLNTGSEILTQDWLGKLMINLSTPNVGLVGATASYESLQKLDSAFLAFPNIHIRSTAFMIDRKLFLSITAGLKITCKNDAYFFESGPKSLTQQVLDRGKDILLVGRNGRGYSPDFWSTSDTFRQGAQKNLLIADNQTRNFLALTWSEKRDFFFRTWLG